MLRPRCARLLPRLFSTAAAPVVAPGFAPRPLMADDSLTAFRDSVRKFMETEIAPYHAQWEEDGIVPRSAWRAAGDAGLLGCDMPAAYGGSEAGFLYSAVVIEELAFAGLSGPSFALHSDIVLPYIATYGSEQQRQRWLPPLIAGEAVSAIAMTEPGTGSDLQAIATTAKRQPDGSFLLNGAKTFISNGFLADVIVVVARTGDAASGGRGLSLFLLDTTADGFSRGRNLNKLGLRAQDTAELFMEDVRLPADSMLGTEGSAFAALMSMLPQERLVIGMECVAAAEAALAWTVDYTKQRQAFGKPLIAQQTVAHTLAEMKADIYAGRTLVDHCLQLHQQQQLTAETAALVKFWASDMQGRIADSGLQLHGGYGYMWEYAIARHFADARVKRIYGGSNEVMKEVVSRAL
eukprot:PLAT14830.1.p1 GENE.PLAT14830.1~~PLAT14830.1.p1  ORF type:complete len:407 (-),score=220.54 PLAT14830.1:319-1539(-)